MKVRDLVREVPDGVKQGAHMLDNHEGPEDSEAPSQEELAAMSKEDLVLAFSGKKPFFKSKFQRNGVKPPPRNISDMTCPNCNEKGHLGQDCPKPKIYMKARKCFICGAVGCIAKTCPKKKEMAKALTANGGSLPVWFGCVAESCQEPKHREKNRKRMQSWAEATAAATRLPEAFTLGDAMGSVFTQLAKLEAAEVEGDVEALRPEGPRPRPSSSSQSAPPVPQVPL